MELGLGGRVAVITGGASGIGRETASYLAAEGMKLVIADINEANIEATVAELRGRGGQAVGVCVDVRSAEECAHMADAAVEAFGAIDVLVAGAGVAGTMDFFMKSKPADWEATLDINIKGVLNSNYAVAPIMMRQGRGSIVNIGSEAGKVGEKRMVVYSATKGAVIAFTKAFAVEMGRSGVRVNAVCPGVTHTPMTAGYTPEQIAASSKFYPMGRLGKPDDIAAMITFLASDQTSWVTGQAISVSGGFGRS